MQRRVGELVIHLVQPPAAGAVSGGFRFNREVARRLVRDRAGRTVSLLDLAPRELTARDTVVFDSLYLSEHRATWLERFDGLCCLLLHYLPSRQPQLAPDERASLTARERRWFEIADRVLVPSYRFATRVRARLPRSVEVHVATPGMGTAFRRAKRQRTLSAQEPLKLVTVDALTAGKNVAAILRALVALPSGSFTWDVAGDLGREPVYRDAFASALSGTPFARQVRLIEGLSPTGVARLLDRSHLYVSASREESYGMATAEAVARGLPVVSFDVGCTSKWVIPDVNGCLVAPGDDQALRGALVGLAGDRQRLQRFAAAAKRASARLQFPTWSDTYEAFRRALARTPRRQAERRARPSPPSPGSVASAG